MLHVSHNLKVTVFLLSKPVMAITTFAFKSFKLQNNC